MKKYSFENQGANTYLVYTVQETDAVDSMTLGMLTHNKISGLAVTTFTQVDSEKYLKYNISAKISVKQFFSGPVNRKRLLGVFNGIVDAILSAEEYMIDPDSILLDTEYIFSDVTTCDTVLVCLPIEGMDNNNDLGSFFKNLMFNTQFDQTENCDHVAKIINYLNSAPQFSPSDFKMLLVSVENQGKSPSDSAIKDSRPSKKTTDAKTSTHPASQRSVTKEEVRPIDMRERGDLERQRYNQPFQRPEKEIEAGDRHVSTTNTKTNVDDSERISFFHLLRNYSKENVAKYQAQKEVDKAAKTTTSGKSKTLSNKRNKSSNKKKTDVVGFSVPGQEEELSLSQNVTQNIPREVLRDACEQNVGVVQQRAEAEGIQKQEAIHSSAQRTRIADFGDTVDLRQVGHNLLDTTTDLQAFMANQSSEIQRRGFLIRRSNNERIVVKTPEFRLGRDPEFADYCFNERDLGVGKSHAIIYCRDGDYCVVDLNSRNHTFVNGEQIPSSTEFIIQSGDSIRFANIDFDFKVE